MQKRTLSIAVLLAILLAFLSHVGTKLLDVPTFALAEEEKIVYLTFDDGPSTLVTNQVLDVLQKNDVKATFFIVSDRAKTRKDVLKRIVKEGHSVGVHSASHDYAQIYASADALLSDVHACADFIKKETGVYPTLYRFPGGGHKNAPVRAVLEDEGFRIIGWNAVCGDEELLEKDPESLYLEAVRSSKGKNKIVLLCHDSAHRKTTAEMLPKLINYYRSEGYTFSAL